VRFPTQLDVLVRADGGKTGVEWRARVRDISTKGVALVLPRSFTPGTILVLKLRREATDNAPCPIQVQVSRVIAESCAYVIGCQFTTPLTGDELTALIQ
jgi:hypothetical protein